MMAATLLLSALSAQPEVGSLIKEVRAMVEGRDVFPALARVQSAAVDALELEPEATAKTWSSRARDRGWVPRLDVRVGTDADRDVRALGQVGETWTEARGLGADVALRWQLGDVVFADVELRVNRERLARAAATRLARERVTKAFFRRIEVELALRLEPDVDPERVVEAARLDGLLRALTGGVWRVAGAEL